MDVQIYSFVIPALIATWGITRGEAGALGTAALLVSAVGGWLAGWIADRSGRVGYVVGLPPLATIHQDFDIAQTAAVAYDTGVLLLLDVDTAGRLWSPVTTGGIFINLHRDLSACGAAQVGWM